MLVQRSLTSREPFSLWHGPRDHFPQPTLDRVGNYLRRKQGSDWTGRLIGFASYIYIYVCVYIYCIYTYIHISVVSLYKIHGNICHSNIKVVFLFHRSDHPAAGERGVSTGALFETATSMAGHSQWQTLRLKDAEFVDGRTRTKTLM